MYARTQSQNKMQGFFLGWPPVKSLKITALDYIFEYTLTEGKFTSYKMSRGKCPNFQ